MLLSRDVLSAVGSSAITALTIEAHRQLNYYERTELDALIFYAARHQNMSESDLRHEVLDTINVTGFDMMTEQDFLAARRYLQNKVD